MGYFITKVKKNEFEVLYDFDTEKIIINLLSNTTAESVDIDTFILNFKLVRVKVGPNKFKKYKYKDKIVLDERILLTKNKSVYNDPKTLYDNIKFLKELKTYLLYKSPLLMNTPIKKQLFATALEADSSIV